MKKSTRFPEFGFYFFTVKYEETVAFYREVLQLKVDRSWNRSEQHRGTVFVSPNGAGFIEIEKGDGLPQIDGGFYIEVDDIEGWYERAMASEATVKKTLGITDYGHLNFKVVDPSGVEVGFSQWVTQA